MFSKSSYFVILLIILGFRSQNQKRYCKQFLLQSYGFDSLIEAQQVNNMICKGIEYSCCDWKFEFQASKNQFDYELFLDNQIEQLNTSLDYILSQFEKTMVVPDQFQDREIDTDFGQTVSQFYYHEIVDGFNRKLQQIKQIRMSNYSKLLCSLCDYETHIQAQIKLQTLLIKQDFCISRVQEENLFKDHLVEHILNNIKTYINGSKFKSFISSNSTLLQQINTLIEDIKNRFCDPFLTPSEFGQNMNCAKKCQEFIFGGNQRLLGQEMDALESINNIMDIISSIQTGIQIQNDQKLKDQEYEQADQVYSDSINDNSINKRILQAVSVQQNEIKGYFDNYYNSIELPEIIQEGDKVDFINIFNQFDISQFKLKMDLKEGYDPNKYIIQQTQIKKNLIKSIPTQEIVQEQPIFVKKDQNKLQNTNQVY